MKQKIPLQFKASDVLKKEGQSLILGGTKLTSQEVKNLQAEVKYFKSLRLYSIFTETVKDQARMIMFEKAMTFDDMRSGKAILHAIGVLENILNTVDKASTMPLVIKPGVIK